MKWYAIIYALPILGAGLDLGQKCKGKDPKVFEGLLQAEIELICGEDARSDTREKRAANFDPAFRAALNRVNCRDPKVVEALNKAGAGQLCRKALVHMFGTTTPPPKLNCEEDEGTNSEKGRAVKRAVAPEFRAALNRVNCRDVSLRILMFMKNSN